MVRAPEETLAADHIEEWRPMQKPLNMSVLLCTLAKTKEYRHPCSWLMWSGISGVVLAPEETLAADHIEEWRRMQSCSTAFCSFRSFKAAQNPLCTNVLLGTLATTKKYRHPRKRFMWSGNATSCGGTR
jgi:hypothetical protein